jgi:predicted ATPase
VLTRIEINGFKTFEGFGMDVNPFMVILGPNASGKSNLFDAIRLLSYLAGTDLRTAVKELRGEPHELFRRQLSGLPGTRMSLAVEVLLDPEVRDPWGATVQIIHSRVRYQVEIERRKDERGIERLVVAREEATPILSQDDRWKPGGQRPSAPFRHRFMKYVRRVPWLTTVDSGGRPSFKIGQDGRAGRTRSAEAAEATVLSSITSAEFPHLYALREELRSWRFLQLDPAALRRPSPTTAAEELEPDGSNLATVLARIQAESRSEKRPRGALADISADLASLVPRVVDVGVEEDTNNREYRIDITMRDGAPFSSRVVSDGTLRILALLTLLHDPKHRGVVCFEEPENGIHPSRLKAVIQRLRELVADPSSTGPDETAPLTQILLNSHSPVVLSALHEHEIVFADIVSVVQRDQEGTDYRTRIRPVGANVQGELLTKVEGEYVNRFQVEQFLTTVNSGA